MTIVRNLGSRTLATVSHDYRTPTVLYHTLDYRTGQEEEHDGGRHEQADEERQVGEGDADQLEYARIVCVVRRFLRFTKSQKLITQWKKWQIGEGDNGLLEYHRVRVTVYGKSTVGY